MAKSILISVNPKWCAKILNGEKTIEIRKTMPKRDLPIDVYIYCTKNGGNLVYGDDFDGGSFYSHYAITRGYSKKDADRIFGLLNGKVVAKFTLNKVEEIDCKKFEIETKTLCEKDLLKLSCLALEELRDYGDFIYSDNCASISSLYAWHISNLVIFDKPKELSEFYKCGFDEAQSDLAMDLLLEDDNCPYEHAFIKLEPQFRLTKAPQSYMFIEVGEQR